MQPVLAWLLAGLLLVVVELMTGSFYLLILGIAAGIGSVVAYVGQPFWMQALVAAIAATSSLIFAMLPKGAGASLSARAHAVGVQDEPAPVSQI